MTTAITKYVDLKDVKMIEELYYMEGPSRFIITHVYDIETRVAAMIHIITHPRPPQPKREIYPFNMWCNKAMADAIDEAINKEMQDGMWRVPTKSDFDAIRDVEK